jgi:hypothetical protein
MILEELFKYGDIQSDPNKIGEIIPIIYDSNKLILNTNISYSSITSYDNYDILHLCVDDEFTNDIKMIDKIVWGDFFLKKKFFYKSFLKNNIFNILMNKIKVDLIVVNNDIRIKLNNYKNINIHCKCIYMIDDIYKVIYEIV